MKVIDMHCDTLGGLLSRREAGNPASLRRNEFHVDLERMKERNVDSCHCCAREMLVIPPLKHTQEQI